MEHNLFTQSNSVSSNRIIYTPSTFARSSLIHLQETGTLQATYPHKSERSGLTSCLFFTVLSGDGLLTYDGVEYELRTGDCVFIDCRKAYSHSTPLHSTALPSTLSSTSLSAEELSCDGMVGRNSSMVEKRLWSLQWCHFYGPNMKAIYRKYEERGGQPVFRSSYLQQYKSILDELYNIAESADYVRDMRIHEKLSGLLVLLMEDAWTEPLLNLSSTNACSRIDDVRDGVSDGNLKCNQRGSEKSDKFTTRYGEVGEVREVGETGVAGGASVDIQSIKDYLDENFKSRITLDDLAHRFYINKSYMQNLFKDRYGCTINNYQNNLRITWVKQQLRFTDKKLEELSLELQIEPTYLSRLFKKIEGVSPSEYRKKWR